MDLQRQALLFPSCLTSIIFASIQNPRLLCLLVAFFGQTDGGKPPAGIPQRQTALWLD